MNDHELPPSIMPPRVYDDGLPHGFWIEAGLIFGAGALLFVAIECSLPAILDWLFR